jgi:hypothetical protein
MTGEHYVSEGILELIEQGSGKVSRSVRAFGLAFQKPKAIQQIGVASLTARILCKTHNGMLGPYDAAGKAMFLAMEALNEAAGHPQTPHRTIRVDGDGLERWMLKVFFGGLYSGNFLIAPAENMKSECPPLDLLGVLFKGAPFPHNQGLYWMPPKQGAKLTTDPQILRVAPLLAQGGQEVGGLCVWLFGFEFCLLTAGIAPGVSTAFDDAVYRPAGMRAIGSNATITFDWQGGAQSPEVELRHEKP